jgi:hypothetical protein
MSTFRYFHQRAFTSDWNGVTFRFGTPWVQGQFLNGFGNFYREKLPWQGNEQIPWPGYLFLQKASIQLIAADSDFTSSSTTALARWRGDQDGLSATFKFNWLGASLTYANVRGAKGEFLCANEKISAHDGKDYVSMDCISLKDGWRFDYEGSTKYQAEALGILTGSK